MTTITIEEKKGLTEPIRICHECLDILCLDGYVDSNFIVSKTIFRRSVVCEICGVTEASFIIIPYTRGIYICSRCLRNLTSTSKHRWQSWPKEEVSNDIPCDLCGQKASIHIIPPRLKK